MTERIGERPVGARQISLIDMSFLAPVSNHPRYRPLAQTDFGGLQTLYGPLIGRRGALRSQNVDYDARRPRKALGFTAVLENAVGAVQVENFDSGEGWTGGSSEVGAENFVSVEAEATGFGSRKLSQVGVGTASMEKTIPSGSGFDSGFSSGFGSGAPVQINAGGLDIIHIWRKALQLPSTITGYQIRLRFQSSAGNYSEAVIAGTGTDEEALEKDLAGNGIPLYARIRRFKFTNTGTPLWASINLIRIELEVTAGTGTLEVAFDNLYWSPAYVQDLFQFRRFLTAGGNRAKNEYAVAGGKLYRNDGLRWAEEATGFQADVPVTSITMDDRRFVVDGKTSPRKIMPDGTVFRMGIVPPPKQASLAQIAGGGLADQTIYVIVKFFSKTTGIESGPDEKTPGTKLVISSGGGNAGVSISNLPVSTDPQVTHLRIFIRPENLSDSQFFRSSGDPDGEIENGTTTFDILETVTNLENFEVMDPDTDYPAYIDTSERLANVEGSIVSATASTAVLDGDAPSTDDALNGRIIRIISGTGSGQIRNIDDYVGDTRTVTPDPDWTTVPDSTSLYRVISTVTGTLKEAHPLFFAQVGRFTLSVFAEQPSTLRHSQADNPEYWPLDNETPLGLNDNDVVTGLASGRGVGLAFKNDAIYPIRVISAGVGPVAGDSISERGSVNHKGITRIEEQIWFRNEDGVYWLDAGLRIHRASAMAQPTWKDLWDARRSQFMVGVELRERFQYYLFGSTLGSQFNNNGWVTNYRRWEGYRFGREPDYDPSIHTYGVDAAAGIEDVNDLRRTWIAKDGVVFQMNSGTSRDGRGFPMRHLTGIWSPDGAGAWVCRWPWLDILAKVAGDSDLLVDVFLGPGLVPDDTLTADLQGNSSPLGQFVLGTSRLGAGSYVHQRLKLPPVKSRFLQMEFRHEGRADVEIQAVTPFYLPITQKGPF